MIRIMKAFSFVSMSLVFTMGLWAQHAATHQHGGGDEVATATPGANAIPKAEADGDLNAGWVSQDSAYTWTGQHDFKLRDGQRISTSFDWSQSPGGALSASSNTITLTPCPTGVNGTNSSHYLWITDTGTPVDEAVLITGGTCTSNASSGTVIFTSIAHADTEWSISSASAGIREALLSESGPTVVIIPPGIHDIEKRITIDEDGDTLYGLGSPGTTVNGGNPPTNSIFGGDVVLNWKGADGGTMLELLPPTDGRLHAIRIENIGMEGNGGFVGDPLVAIGAARGIWTKACTGCYFRNLTITDFNPALNDAVFYISAGDGTGTGKSFRNNKLDFINIRASTNSIGAGMRFQNGTHATSDINTNDFVDIQITYFGEAGIYAHSADGNTFRRVGASGGTGPGWLTPSDAHKCGQQIFLGMALEYENKCDVTNEPDLFLGWDADAQAADLITVENKGKVVVYHEDKITTIVGSSGENGLFIDPELCIDCLDPQSTLDVDGVVTVRPQSALSTIQSNSTNSRIDFITDRATTSQVAFRFRDAAGNALLDILDSGDAVLTGDLAVDGSTTPTDVSLRVAAGIDPGILTQANLPSNGIVWCTDCNVDSTCTASGGGAWARCRGTACACNW